MPTKEEYRLMKLQEKYDMPNATESERGNPVMKLDIYHPSYQETVYGWKGYYRLKQLDNLVSEEDLKEYKANLMMTNKLYNNKNK